MLRSRGSSRRQIARELGLDRETVGRLLRLSGSPAPGAASDSAESNPASVPAGNEDAGEAWPPDMPVRYQPNAYLKADHQYTGSFWLVRKLRPRPMQTSAAAPCSSQPRVSGKATWIFAVVLYDTQLL